MRLSHEEKSAIETLIKIADTSGARDRVATGWVDWNIHLAKGILERLASAGAGGGRTSPALDGARDLTDQDLAELEHDIALNEFAEDTAARIAGLIAEVRRRR